VTWDFDNQGDHPRPLRAISVPDEGPGQLAVIIEVKKRSDSDEDAMHKHEIVKCEVTLPISNSHGLSVADLVLVPSGSIPIHHQQQGQASSVCRAVPAPSVRPFERLGA
jgi:hypothetical protein